MKDNRFLIGCALMLNVVLGLLIYTILLWML
jgi:hypothetical protein